MLIKCTSSSKASYLAYNQVSNRIIWSLDSLKLDAIATFKDFIDVIKIYMMKFECI